MTFHSSPCRRYYKNSPQQPSRERWSDYCNSDPSWHWRHPPHHINAWLYPNHVPLVSFCPHAFLTPRRLTSSFPSQHLAHKTIIAVRALFTIAAALLIAGSTLVGNYKKGNLVSIGEKLVKAGYFVFAAVLAIEIVFHVYMWSRKARLTDTSMIVSSTQFLVHQESPLILDCEIDSQSDLLHHTLPHCSHSLRSTVRLRDFP
jgi:uncharacterized membrane protein